MPEKPLKVASYAAGASLAAITLVYVFAPTFFLDGDSAASHGFSSSQKKTVVGLSNPANDCFINSVLQALAGLGDLRLYLIRETHRRELDGPEVYAQLVEDPARKDMPAWKREGLQGGLVTKGLKDILNALNERPIHKKTISANQFVVVLEQAFKQRISRQQQDAQEFLQVVAERLCDEYHEGHRARKHARNTRNGVNIDQADEASLRQSVSGLSLHDAPPSTPDKSEPTTPSHLESGSASSPEKASVEEPGSGMEEGFPLEGCSESQIECLTCGFKPTPTKSTFCSLTLSVPRAASTTLSSCFDQMFKTEYIEDFKCEKCRLVHALETFKQELSKPRAEKLQDRTQMYIEQIQNAIDSDPEKELEDVALPDRKWAPKRKIAKHVRITQFPKIMAIHLSRSIFHSSGSTLKNSAKVSFPERLPLGGLMNQKHYRLSSVVCHKGSHQSGHYESFRRQKLPAPYSTPHVFQPVGVYSKPPSSLPSQLSTPRSLPAQQVDDLSGDLSTLPSTPDLPSPASAASSSPSSPSYFPGGGLGTMGRRSSTTSRSIPAEPPATSGPTSAPRPSSDTASIRSRARSTRSIISHKLHRHRDVSSPASPDASGVNASAKRKRKSSHRWWRISDEKIKECKTSDVLGMQREVYLLFYELEREPL